MYQQQQQGQFIFPVPNNISENKISYKQNPNQKQYASYPSNAIYHHASGPGWQQQQIFYPANSTNYKIEKQN